jgi:hypothetical protein
MTQSQQHLADTVSEIARAHTSVATTLENSATHVAESSDLLHSTLEDALSTSLHTLSSSLASISAKFAMDYGQVADYLRDIVQMAGKAHDDDDAPG